MPLPIRLMLIAILSSILFGYLFTIKAESWGFIDKPGERKVHFKSTPRTGGFAMFAGGLTTTLIGMSLGWITVPKLPWQSALAGFGFIVVGGLDDRFSFLPKRKILFFLALAALAAWPWALRVAAPDFPGVHLGPATFRLPAAAAFPLLTLWFMAVPNCLNIEDAINGYMGGFTLIVLAALAASGLQTGVFIGLLFGFLLLNWPRAKHFLGDAGSFGCGFVVAEAILQGGGLLQPATALILTAPISLDVAMGLIRRRRLKMSPFDADQNTCPHHVLRMCGGSHFLASAFLWANVSAFAVLAFFPDFALPYAIAYVTFLFFANKSLLFSQSKPVHPESKR